MTDDDDVKLDSHRRDHDRDSCHDGERRSRLPTLRRYVVALLVRHGRPADHEIVYLLLLPTLYFRLSPLIITHNSTTLSAYLALVLVYIPAKVILSACGAYLTSSHAGSRWRKRKSRFLLPLNMSSATPPMSSSQRTMKSLLWTSGALFSLWVYTWGISSPFPTASSVISSSPTLQAQQARNASYFIAVSFWNNEDILDSWTAQTLQLIDALGRSNVYLSLTENDSEDNTASKLLHFGRELTKRNVTHSVNITTDLRGYPPENPWRSVRHRMEYMANLRNGVLAPLGRLDRRFESVVLLNDIMYHHTDVLKLIAAVGGDDNDDDDDDDDDDISEGRTGRKKRRERKRRMACGVDMDGASLYDTWVLRDRCGRPASGFWPFFASDEDRRSVRESRVLDVGTCWNGIVVLDGDMLLDARLRSEGAGWSGEPLRFRQPPECIISECALLPLAITNATGGAPVVMDPSVVVAYKAKWWRYYSVWLRTPVVRLWMRAFEERYWGLWWNLGMGRALRWTGLELDSEKEEGECVVEGWPRCGSSDYVARGAMTLRNPLDEL